MTTANIKINGVTGSNTDWTLNTLVPLDTSTTGSSYLWSLVSQPAGAPDSLVNPTLQSPSFTPTKEGSYLISLVVNAGPLQSVGQVVLGVRELQTGNRIPAIGETTEASSTDGWASTAVDEILQRVTRLTDAGVLTGVAGDDLTVGDVVWASNVYTLAAGLPGERVVPSWAKALATNVPAMQGVFGIVAGSVLGGTITSGKVISVQTTGLFQGLPFGATPSVGDKVYISDVGSMALSHGTLERQIGTVCAVGVSTYDVMLGPAPVEITQLAGGDLSGTYPDPTVVGLQTRPVASTAPTNGQVLKYNGTAWAPATDSTTPTGSAGGVLGYTASTYPNPSGLAPVTGSTIPVKGTAAATTTFQVDGSTGGTQAPSLSLRAGANGGGGEGGDATLKAGNSTTGAGGTVYITGGDGDNDGGVAQLLGGDSSYAEGATVASGAASTTEGGGVTLIGGLGPIGGAITITAGQGDTTLGGDVTINAGVSGAGIGGNVYMTAGVATTGAGGEVSIIGGVGTSTGGPASLTGGAGTSDGGWTYVTGGSAGTLDGGKVVITGGASLGERGGAVVITGGNSTGSGAAPDGGSIQIDGGVGQTNGIVRVGADNAQYVVLGRDNKDVIVNGRNVETEVTYAPVAGTTIPVTSPTIFLAATAPRTMTALPNIQTSGITAGTRVTFIGGANAVTFQRESALTGSGLRLGNPTQTVDLYDVITLIFDGTYWREASFMSNS